MRVLVVLGAFGDLPAADAVNAVATGWRRHDPDAGLDLAPLPASASSLTELLESSGVPERAEAVDLVVTGERVFDAGSLADRLPRGVAWVAQRTGRPCVVLAERVLVGRREFSAAGVDAAYALDDTPGRASGPAAARLSDLAERVARSWTPRRAR